MKLHKALKIKKNLVGEITKLKQQIKSKNSYLEGSANSANFDLNSIYLELQEKINKLLALKYAIHEANLEIQYKIFVLSETKALITFWNEVNVIEGKQTAGYAEKTILDYKVHFNESERDNIIKNLQLKVDAIQEEIDTYNYNTEIAWDEAPKNE